SRNGRSAAALAFRLAGDIDVVGPRLFKRKAHELAASLDTGPVVELIGHRESRSQRQTGHTREKRGQGPSPSSFSRHAALHSQNLRAYLRKIIINDFAEAERQIGNEVARGNDLANRQAGNVAHGMLEELNGGRPGPSAFQRDILEVVADKLANTRGT